MDGKMEVFAKLRFVENVAHAHIHVRIMIWNMQNKNNVTDNNVFGRE
jgi:hypothetical protein